MANVRMPETLPRRQPGSHREEGSHDCPCPPSDADIAANIKRESDALAERKMFAEAIAAFGGAAALVKALGEKDSYGSKISEGVSGSKPIQTQWLTPLLSDEAARPIVLAHFDALSSRDEHTEAMFVEDSHSFYRSNEAIADIFRGYVVKRRGIKASRVRL